MDTLLLIAAIAVFLLLIMLFTRPKEGGRKPVPRALWQDPEVQKVFDQKKAIPAQRSSPSSAHEQQWEKRVLTQLRGNREAMERLLAGKAKRVPRASRAQLLELIHADYVRDQR